MLIRKSEPGDADQVAEVAVQAFAHGGWGHAHDMARDEELQREFGDDQRQRCLDHPDWVCVAVEDNQVVGFVMIEYAPEQQAGCIGNNAVLPAYQNRGISTELVSRAIEELKNLGAKHIKVRTAHEPAACRVYEKAGFALVNQAMEHDSHGALGVLYYYEMHL